MSNPATQNKTLKENSTGSISKLEVKAKYAPIGASDKPNPKIK